MAASASFLPSELLQAAAFHAGGKLALVLGAGCSIEAPTGVPAARACSKHVHRLLVADGVINEGVCKDPSDLSEVADVVFAKYGSQRHVVERLLDSYGFKLASPNHGYYIAAALLCEGVISSLVTLNFDLAISAALANLGVKNVGVVERPEDLPKQQTTNVYYLHRNANAEDPERWVLRTAALEEEWKSQWEGIVAQKVLSAPVVVFAGLGTPIAVLIESIRLLRTAIPEATKVFQVDPASIESSDFFQKLTLDQSAYLQVGWCAFMDHLSRRVTQEQIAKIGTSIEAKVKEEKLSAEPTESLLSTLEQLGLVDLGKVRSCWLLHDKPYMPSDSQSASLLADLIFNLGFIGRVSGTIAEVKSDGSIAFNRGSHSAADFTLASGSGHRSMLAVEARVESTYAYRNKLPPTVLVSGTTDTELVASPPPSIVDGNGDSKDILSGASARRLINVSSLRQKPALIKELIP